MVKRSCGWLAQGHLQNSGYRGIPEEHEMWEKRDFRKFQGYQGVSEEQEIWENETFEKFGGTEDLNMVLIRLESDCECVY